VQRVCVNCGSNFGSDPAFKAAATAVGRLLAEQGRGLVSGGGSVGLMGVVADATLAGGGEVIGVIPRKLVELEKEHRGLTKLIETDTMHERKRLMMEHADGFLVLPGGYGTLEELFEVIAWLQLGFHRKPVGLLNVAGFYDAMLVQLDHMAASGLLKAEHRAMLLVSSDPATLLDGMAAFEPTDAGKWL
jgi:uncharacterized protein (TIGR00730 family)